jgi:cytoskeletal protein RodZ
MTLNDIREEHSLKAISKKTNISEENIEAIVAEDFSSLPKAKGLGFISILEREYGADLQAIRAKALTYYEEHKEAEESINIALPRIEGKKGRSKLFPLLMLGLLAYATWYFFTQFDKRTLGNMIPFTEEKSEVVDEIKQPLMKTGTEPAVSEASLNIKNALNSVQTDATGVETDIVVANIEPREASTMVHGVEVVTEVKEESASTGEVAVVVPDVAEKIALIPEKRLWFGLVDMDTGKRDHFSISDKFEIDVKQKSWLVATSSAAFSFVNAEVTQEYNDAKEHYFKVSKEGVELLTKPQYVSQGGYKKW